MLSQRKILFQWLMIRQGSTRISIALPQAVTLLIVIALFALSVRFNIHVVAKDALCHVNVYWIMVTQSRTTSEMELHQISRKSV